MSQYPQNELKRRLQDDDIPLAKRLKLARNVVQSHHFPTASKERVIAEWLDDLTKSNKLTSKELCDVLGWLNNVDDFTCELKNKLIKVVYQYLNGNILQNNDPENIVAFLENTKISHQLSLHIEEFLFITTTLLQNLHNDSNYPLVNTILNNIGKYYKESKKKLQFIIKLLEGENLETIFSFLHTECHKSVIDLCQNVLFPVSKKQIFTSFLTNLIRKDNIDDLIAEKGDNIQSVLKIMSSFFTFPKGRTSEDPKFLTDFIDVFISCYSSESKICFTFYIMATDAFKMSQNYILPAMQMPAIKLVNEEKTKRNIFLKMLEILLSHEVDLSFRLTDTLGEKITKVEIKKTFITFIQAVMLGQLKLEGKLDKVTLEILQVALKLDPSIIEQKIDIILPYIMTAKKKKSDIIEHYRNMMNYFLETLFKLSRGAEFINKIIPHIKLSLETTNVEQFELKQKLTEAVKNGDSVDKIKAAILNGNDILPPECIELYGRLSSDLMFRQNRILLLSLQKDFEENCLMMLEEGFVSPSIITLSEVLSAILSSFFRHNKMADHTVPLPIAEEFWSTFQDFENQCLNKFGECVLKLNYNPPLVISFLQLCQDFSQLKLLNIKYGNTKVSLNDNKLVPFLHTDKWIEFTSRIQEEDAILVWDHLQVIQSMSVEILTETEQMLETKTNILKRVSSYSEILTRDNYFINTLFRNLNKTQIKIVSKAILKDFSNNNDISIFKTAAVSNNRDLLKNVLLKVSKNIIDCVENTDVFSTALNKTSFEVNLFVKENNVMDLFENTNIINEEELSNNIEILKQLQIHYLTENYQLTAIMVLLVVKNCCQHKKIKRNIDTILKSIYELSPKYPDVYKIFSVDNIFDFKNNTILELLKINNKTSKSVYIIRNILEIAVKKVKTDADVIKNIVEILLKNHTNKITSINNFDNPVFEITCLALPTIAKEKKNITTSAYRSILADLQEKLNAAILDSFKNINFDTNVLENESSLNSMGAYTLTLSKFCESFDNQNLNLMLAGLKYFVDMAIQSIQEPTSKAEHVETSINLLNVTLRYWKRLTVVMENIDKSKSSDIFADTDKFYQRVWVSITCRLSMVFDQRQKRKISHSCLDEISVTLKFLAELSSVECFCRHFVGDLSKLALLKNPSFILKKDDITNSQLTSRRVSKYLWQNCLRANIIEAKCVAMTKIIFRATKNIKSWIQQHYDNVNIENNEVKIDDRICELLRNDLDVLCEVILAAKKINLDYKFLDSIFELTHLFQYMLGANAINTKCVTSWGSFVMVFEGCVVLLNNILLSREEMLEDRWPCYMQCYKTLILCLCERAKIEDEADISIEHKLAEMAHSIEKLTHSICKRKTHVSRISAYAVADICSWIEVNFPPKMLRQHLENSVAMLIQASDSSYAMAFLRRALAGSLGQMTMTNMYTMYKRYHKYVGNA